MSELKTICTESLELHCAAGESGRLDLRRDNFGGNIYVYGGFIVHAELAGLEGIPALFRLFDWGDAKITWVPDEVAERSSLNLQMQQACQLYAEHLHDRAGLDADEKANLAEAFDTMSLVTGETEAVDSALRHYTVTLECTEKEYLPTGFSFSEKDKQSFVIGSADDCDVILRHPSVDPLHCGVILERGHVKVWDLGAQSGVRLNGKQVQEGNLKVGDLMTLGMLDLQVHFHLKRPVVARPPTTPVPAVPTPVGGPPPKEIPKGAITYAKVSKSLQGDKGKPFLTKLGSLFGSKDK